MDKYEEIARKYVEGIGGLFDLYKYEKAFPLCRPPEVEGARWMLVCLTNPSNRDLLDELVEQSEARKGSDVGFCVTNGALTVGSSGSVVIPDDDKERVLLIEAIKVARERFSDQNGQVSPEVWNDNYGAVHALDGALAQLGVAVEKQPCPECHGIGCFVSTIPELARGNLPGTVDCSRCDGTGTV